MRVNVYAEELTLDTQIVTQKVETDKGTRTFYGVRVFLKSPDELHHSANDDDRSAVTFWVPFRGGANHFFDLACVFQRMLKATQEAELQEKTK